MERASLKPLRLGFACVRPPPRRHKLVLLAALSAALCGSLARQLCFLAGGSRGTDGIRRVSFVRRATATVDAAKTVEQATLDAAEPLGLGSLEDFGTRHQVLRIAPNSYAFTVSAATLLKSLYDPDCLLFVTHGGEIQRNLDAAHLAELKQYQLDYMEAHGYYSFPSPIFIAKHEGKYAVIDGQHRLEVIRFLHQSSDKPIKVLVSMVELESLNEYDDYFVALNKNKPVRLYRNVKGWKEVLKALEAYLKSTFPAYFKKSARPRPPNQNLDALMAYMDENDMVAKIGLGFEDLVTEIEDLNAVYQEHWKELIKDKGYIPTIEKLVATVNKTNLSNPFYLGIYRNFEWLKRIQLRVKSGMSYRKMNHVPDTYSPKVPKKLRRAVWEKRNAPIKKAVKSTSGQCFICCCELEFGDAECGHVISLANCGETEYGNLEPVCKECNSEMGSENMGTFIDLRRKAMLE